MSNNAFPCAIYRNGDEEKVITPKELILGTSYTGRLFCPNPNCGARLKAVPRKNGYIFQSIDIKSHIDGCEYYHDYPRYDDENKFRKSYSENHVVQALRRKLKQLTKGGAPVYTPPVAKGPQKATAKRKEGTVVTYNAEQIDTSFLGRAIAVYGIVENVHIVEKENVPIHAYINFRTSDESPLVSVLISNNLYKKFDGTKDAVEVIKRETEKFPKGAAHCICFGWICAKNKNKGLNVSAWSPAVIQLY